MQNENAVTETTIEREMRLPDCSPEERRQELELLRDNLGRMLQQAANILSDPKQFYCCLHSAHLGLATGTSWQIPLGVLILLWQEGKMITTCSHCAGKTHIIGAAGSPLSGTNTFTGICVNCSEVVSGRLADFQAAWQPLLNMRIKYSNKQKVLRRKTRRFSWEVGITGKETPEIVLQNVVQGISLQSLVLGMARTTNHQCQDEIQQETK